MSLTPPEPSDWGWFSCWYRLCLVFREFGQRIVEESEGRPDGVADGTDRRTTGSKQADDRGRVGLVSSSAMLRESSSVKSSSGNVSASGFVSSSSAWYPSCKTMRVATARASHSLSARCGSVILVFCQFHPPRLMRHCSIQARWAYHCGDVSSRSVRRNHGSLASGARKPARSL